METIIDELSRALRTFSAEERSVLSSTLVASLNSGDLTWIENLPISIANRRDRVKNSQQRAVLSQHHCFNDDGTSKAIWKRFELGKIVSATKEAFQVIDLAVTKHADRLETLHFHNRRPNDYWKRLQNVEPIDAVVGLQYAARESCSGGLIEDELAERPNGQWHVESELRDAMRSEKENSGLREKPFVWVIVTEKNAAMQDDHIMKLLQHYFGANTLRGSGMVDFYIGYSTSLDAVSLRTFYKKN